MPTRRQFLAGSAAAAGAVSLPSRALAAEARPAQAPDDRRQPNIVLILHDDLGYGETGPYGQKVISTPNIDALAAQGLRFTSYYGGGCTCAPSRSVALTGLHLGHTTVRQNPENGISVAFADTDVTFANILKSRGYATAAFGKWGFGPVFGDQPSHPNERGFDEFFGYISHTEAHNYYPPYLWHNAAKFPLDGQTYAPPLFADRTIQFIKDNSDGPFLVYLAPNLPHAPSTVPTTDPYNDPTWTQANRGHAYQVSLLDAHIGQIRSTVEELGIAEDTIIIVTGDHGPHEEGGVNPDFFGSRGPLRGYKRNLYEGGIRIPFIAWGPGRVPAGVTDAPAGHVDLIPTFAELADTIHPSDLDGHSFAALLTGATTAAPERDHFYWYRRDPYNTSRADATEGGSVTRAGEAIRDGDWKLVRIAPTHTRPATGAGYTITQLYNLAGDLGETADLSASNPDVVASLTAKLDADWVDSYPRVPYGVTVDAPVSLPRGGSATVTVTVANGSAVPLHVGEVRLDGDQGVRVIPVAGSRVRMLEAGESLTTAWRVITPPTGNNNPYWTLTATALVIPDGHQGTVRFSDEATVVAPPEADSYLSDLRWLSTSVGGYGPAEMDESNGGFDFDDGTTISLDGTTYAKGLGAAPVTNISYYLGGSAARFTGVVGIDDTGGAASSSQAQIYGDGVLLFDSGTLAHGTAPATFDVDVADVQVLALHVGPGTQNGYTSWGDPIIHV